MTLVLKSLNLLLKKPSYLLLSIFLAVFLFIIYFVINHLTIFISAFNINPGLFWEVFVNQVRIVWLVAPLNVLAVSSVSLLAGISISLTSIRIKRTKVLIGRVNLFSLLGVSAGSFGATCSACTTSLIAILGVSGGLAVFPLKGLEFLFLATILLLLSLYFTSKSLAENGIVKL